MCQCVRRLTRVLGVGDGSDAAAAVPDPPPRLCTCVSAWGRVHARALVCVCFPLECAAARLGVSDEHGVVG